MKLDFSMSKTGDKNLGSIEIKRRDGEYDVWDIVKRLDPSVGGSSPKGYPIYLIGSFTNTGLLSDYYYKPEPGESENKSLEEINADLEVLASDGESYMSRVRRIPKKIKSNPSAMTYEYYINMDERGEFNADVRDPKGRTIWETDGSVFEDGFMRDKYDVSGLTDYLTQLKIIKKGSQIVRANPTRRRKRCWKGYRPVPGMKPYSKGSCVRANPFRVGGYPRETPEEAGYRVVQLKGRQLILQDKADGKLELWAKSPNHAGYAIYYKNTTFEFVRSLPRQNPSKSRVWKVWDYDVWGNEADGWDVNDRIPAGKIELSETEENNEAAFNKAMEREGLLVRWKDIDEGISSEDAIYFRREEDGYPRGEIIRERS